jgi:hypothetical protein
MAVILEPERLAFFWLHSSSDCRSVLTFREITLRMENGALVPVTT